MTNRETLAAGWSAARRELTTFAQRVVLRPDIAEELVQEAALRLLEASPRPEGDHVRPWLFRVVANLAVDHVRRHSTRRERVMADAKDAAVADPVFMDAMEAGRGDEEHRAIAREHLAICFACTLRAFPVERAVALLLVEVFGFSVREAAAMLDVPPTRAKSWIQSTRAGLKDRYAATCALVSKTGVCHECVELAGYFNGRGDDPLARTPRDIPARLVVLRDLRGTDLGPWHTRLMGVVDGVLQQRPVRCDGEE